MSRVIYSDTPSTVDQETLRTLHQVRIVSGAEEGTGVDNLPGGVYGYTYSPGLSNSPLFAVRRYRSYEIHKLANGDILLAAFASSEDARQLTSVNEDITIQVCPEPEDGRATLVMIPYTRIRQHRQYAAPNQHGFTVTVRPE
jgi:hypothetical protein